MALSELKPKGGGEWVRLGATAVVAAATVSTVAILSQRGDGFSVEVDRSGVFRVSTEGEVALGTVLDRATRDNPREFAALAALYGYYHISSTELVDAVRGLDVEKDAAVVTGLREVLWNLEGPFARPGTLSGAGRQMIDAILDLDASVGDGGSGDLLADLLRRSLVFDPPFNYDHRGFAAEVVPVHDAASAGDGLRVVYACLPDALDDLGVLLAGSGVVTGLIEGRFHPSLECKQGGWSLQDMIAGDPIRLGLDEATFAELAGDVGAGPVEADFYVYPRGQIPAAIP